jgi:hypothetical protein
MYGSFVAAWLVNPVGSETLGWKCYVVFCCLLVALLLSLYLLVPEARGRGLMPAGNSLHCHRADRGNGLARAIAPRASRH